eukprot:Hpha_TRINITY_DN15071_c0_g1::TRINITY_DN15071_c0_g1_i2::g.125280::m.125280
MGDWDGGCDAVAKQELQMKQWLQQVESGYSKPGFGYDPAIFSRHEGEGSLGFIEPLAVHLRDPRSACVNIPELFWWDTPEANFTPPHPLPPVKRGGRDLPGEQKMSMLQSNRLADTTMSTKYLVMPWRPENFTGRVLYFDAGATSWTADPLWGRHVLDHRMMKESSLAYIWKEFAQRGWWISPREPRSCE